MKQEHQKDAHFLRASGKISKCGEPASLAEHNHLEVVDPLSEWNVVIGGKENLALECDTPDILRRDSSVTLEEYVAKAGSEYADVGLIEAELVALRLWTGPMYRRYNYLLREFRSNRIREDMPVLPLSECPPFEYINTIHALNSGIIKLSRRQPAETILYRGLRSTSESKESSTAAFLFKSGVMECPIAFSTLRAEAERYACNGLLLKFDVARTGDLEAGKWAIARGAPIGWLSQFHHEKEILFPLLSRLERIREVCTLDSGGSEWEVRIVACNECRTLEEMAMHPDVPQPVCNDDHHSI